MGATCESDAADEIPPGRWSISRWIVDDDDDLLFWLSLVFLFLYEYDSDTYDDGVVGRG